LEWRRRGNARDRRDADSLWKEFFDTMSAAASTRASSITIAYSLDS